MSRSPPCPAAVVGPRGQPKARSWVVQPGASFIKIPIRVGNSSSSPFSPCRLLLRHSQQRAPSASIRPQLSQPSLCPPPPSEAGISLVSIAIGRRNQHIPVMLIYRPLGCQHKYLINRDMNNTA